MKCEMPDTPPGSPREPELIHTPSDMERMPGKRSVTTRRPLSSVDSL
jgi:hypothetical protein